MNLILKSPLEAAEAAGTDFYTDFPLRRWAVVEAVQRYKNNGQCGELSSLRFTWTRPKKESEGREVLLYRSLPWLLDAAWFLAGGSLEMLHLEVSKEQPGCFALARFSGNITAEFELNEMQPDSLEATYFLKANFSEGHVTNQPVAGHFNVEGSLWADDTAACRVCIDSITTQAAPDEIALARNRFQDDLTAGTAPHGPLYAREIITLIREALQ